MAREQRTERKVSGAIKHAPGCYRLSLEGRRFAQFVKGRFTSSKKWGDEFTRDSDRGRHWAIEIRDAQTGDLIRYAGVWSSLREAIAEIGEAHRAFIGHD